MSIGKVAICNLALSHLGDKANVSDLEEQSSQSDLCRTFYPIALGLLTEQHEWTFATRRVVLAELSSPPPSTWTYAYRAPSAIAQVIAVIPENGDDRCPRPFTMESDDEGNVIFTDEPNAVLRYVKLEDNTDRFSNEFAVALSWLLASYLAGPIVKGDAGVAAGEKCNQVFLAFLAQAKAADANQQQVADDYVPQGIRARLGAGGVRSLDGRIIR